MVYILERYIKKCLVNLVNEKNCRTEMAAGRPFYHGEFFHGISSPGTAHFVL